MITKPKGTTDITGNDALLWEYVNQVVSTMAQTYNYEFIRTPVFESSELFHRSVGETSDIVQKETYDFKDKGDRNLTLRPEGTAGVVRSYIENKCYAEPDVKKYYYNETMYRYERPQTGRMREFTQFGVEVLGSNDPLVDAEVISFQYYILNALHIENLQVNINSLGDAESRLNYKEALVKYLEPHINNLCEDCRERFKTNPLRILDCKVDADSEILKNAPKTIDYLNKESKERFETVLKYLDILDVDYEVNPRIVRGLDYYDHTVFEIVSLDNMDTKANVLGAGGRYNKLIKELDGPESYGIGWACGMDRIINMLKEINLYKDVKKQVECYVMYVSEEEKMYALEITQNLRLNGVVTETDCLNKGLKGQFKQADRLNAKLLVILNNEDLSKGLVNIKDNATKDEEKVDLDEVVEQVIGRL
ncbi:MAG: histidine--tRNA ligase [Firmicutes bacterium]|nr:histidine--tRNA ligase [Bacillota bacterium]